MYKKKSSSIFPNQHQCRRKHFTNCINTWLNEYNLPLDDLDNGFYYYDSQNECDKIKNKRKKR